MICSGHCACFIRSIFFHLYCFSLICSSAAGLCLVKSVPITDRPQKLQSTSTGRRRKSNKSSRSELIHANAKFAARRTQIIQTWSFDIAPAVTGIIVIVWTTLTITNTNRDKRVPCHRNCGMVLFCKKQLTNQLAYANI